MGHRHFLHKEHKFISNRSLFNGRNELRDAPKHLSGQTYLDKLRVSMSHLENH